MGRGPEAAATLELTHIPNPIPTQVDAAQAAPHNTNFGFQLTTQTRRPHALKYTHCLNHASASRCSKSPTNSRRTRTRFSLPPHTRITRSIDPSIDRSTQAVDPAMPTSFSCLSPPAPYPTHRLDLRGRHTGRSSTARTPPGSDHPRPTLCACCSRRCSRTRRPRRSGPTEPPTLVNRPPWTASVVWARTAGGSRPRPRPRRRRGPSSCKSPRPAAARLDSSRRSSSNSR